MYIHKLFVPSRSSRLSDSSQAGLCLSWWDNPNCGWRQKDYTSNRCKDHSPLHPIQSTKPSLRLVVSFKGSSAAISGVTMSQSWNMQQKSLNFKLDQCNKEPQSGIGVDNALIDWLHRSHSRRHEVLGRHVSRSQPVQWLRVCRTTELRPPFPSVLIL